MSLRPETRAIFAPPRGQHGMKKSIFSKLTRSDVFDFPDHLWGFRNANLISTDGCRTQKDEIFDFFQNRDFGPKPFWNDDFAPSNSKFSLLRWVFSSSGHGAKHSFPFWTLTLSWGRGNMAPEAFDVLQCKWVMVSACTHNPGNHLKFWKKDIEIYLRSLSHLDMSSGRWVLEGYRTPSLPQV